MSQKTKPAPRGAGSYPLIEIELRDLAIFLAIVESGSMSVAARQLRLTQSAVSQAVAGMEAALGAKLFDRDIRPLGLTPSGIALKDRAAALLRDAREAVAAVRDLGSGALPHLHLAMLDTVASAMGPHLIANLRGMAARWSVWSGLSANHREALLAREVDVIITAEADALAEGDFERHDIVTEPHLLVLPARYTAQVDDLAALARDLDFIRFSARSHTGRQIEQHLRRLRIEPPVRLEFDTSDALLAMVANGIGWTLATPLCILQGAQHLPQLRCVAMPAPVLFRRVTLVARRGELGDVPARIAAASMAVFRDICVPQIEDFAPGTSGRITLGHPG
jgi:DNA-binding transcriptional LysR family regulator